MTLIRRRTNSATSDLGLRWLPIPNVPNLDAISNDPDQTWHSDQVYTVCRCPQPLDRTILNLGDVSFVLFDVSLQNKILHCK